MDSRSNVQGDDDIKPHGKGQIDGFCSVRRAQFFPHSCNTVKVF